MKKKLSIILVSLISLVSLSSCDTQPVESDTFVKKMFGSWESLVIQLTSTLILFCVVGFFVFKPVRKILQTRQDYVVSQVKNAEAYKEDALNKQKKLMIVSLLYKMKLRALSKKQIRMQQLLKITLVRKWMKKEFIKKNY